MSTSLKSNVVSLALHASVIAALLVIPASEMRRFVQTGEAQVVSLEATFQRPNESPIVPLEWNVEPLENRLEPTNDQVATEPVDRRPFTSMLARPKRSNSVPELPVPTRLEQDPNIVSSDTVPPPRLERQTSSSAPEIVSSERTERRKIEPEPPEPPSSASTPTMRLVGQQGKAAADFSKCAPPPYPAAAIEQRLEGVVLLSLAISAKGRVENAEIVRSSGHAVLDQAALKAVTDWQGTPARRWGRAVSSVERIPIRFRL